MRISDWSSDVCSSDLLGVFTPQEYAPSFSDWNFSYDLTATWKAARDLFLYATYAKTFKSGGINQNGVPNGADGNLVLAAATVKPRSEEHTSELQSLMRISYAVFCLKKKTTQQIDTK